MKKYSFDRQLSSVKSLRKCPTLSQYCQVMNGSCSKIHHFSWNFKLDTVDIIFLQSLHFKIFPHSHRLWYWYCLTCLKLRLHTHICLVSISSDWFCKDCNFLVLVWIFAGIQELCMLRTLEILIDLLRLSEKITKRNYYW